MEPVSQPGPQRPSAWVKISGKLFRLFCLEPVPAPQSRLLGRLYSISLDNWGVELQRSGRLPEARHRFEQALALNTNNWVATINLQCNTNLQAGNKLSLAGLEEMAGRFKDMQQIALGMNSCGPFDEPVLCFLLGRARPCNTWSGPKPSRPARCRRSCRWPSFIPATGWTTKFLKSSNACARPLPLCQIGRASC